MERSSPSVAAEDVVGHDVDPASPLISAMIFARAAAEFFISSSATDFSKAVLLCFAAQSRTSFLLSATRGAGDDSAAAAWINAAGIS